MTKDEALKTAIEVMENIEIPYRQYAEKAINACKEALEQPESWLDEIQALTIKECISVIENSTDRHRKEYFAELLRKHWE
jgi:hypothetical protein